MMSFYYELCEGAFKIAVITLAVLFIGLLIVGFVQSQGQKLEEEQAYGQGNSDVNER